MKKEATDGVEGRAKIIKLPHTRATWRQLARQASDLTAELTAIGHERRKLEQEAHAAELALQQVWQIMHGWTETQPPKAA